MALATLHAPVVVSVASVLADPVQRRADALTPAQVSLLLRLASAPFPLRLPPGVLAADLADLVVVGPDRRVALSAFGRAVAQVAVATVCI